MTRMARAARGGPTERRRRKEAPPPFRAHRPAAGLAVSHPHGPGRAGPGRLAPGRVCVWGGGDGSAGGAVLGCSGWARVRLARGEVRGVPGRPNRTAWGLELPVKEEARAQVRPLE